jgi:opacity protein-like surface antigen
MGNLLIGVPIGGQHGVGFRPYAVGGVGIIKSRIGSSGDFFNIDSTDFGFNVGAGAIFFFSDKVGLRGDVRYFQSLEDVEPLDDLNIGLANFRFWRGTLGVTIRF